MYVFCDFKYWNFAKGTRAEVKSLKGVLGLLIKCDIQFL
jgi:hypothetical protein